MKLVATAQAEAMGMRGRGALTPLISDSPEQGEAGAAASSAMLTSPSRVLGVTDKEWKVKIRIRLQKQKVTEKKHA